MNQHLVSMFLNSWLHGLSMTSKVSIAFIITNINNSFCNPWCCIRSFVKISFCYFFSSLFYASFSQQKNLPELLRQNSQVVWRFVGKDVMRKIKLYLFFIKECLHLSVSWLGASLSLKCQARLGIKKQPIAVVTWDVDNIPVKNLDSSRFHEKTRL